MGRDNNSQKDGDKKPSNEKNLDEKLITWKDIFEELTVDAQTLIKDLSNSIDFIAISAIMLLLIGGAAIVVSIIQDKGTKYIAAGVIIFCLCAGNASMSLLKWHRLKMKYKRLQSLQKEMEHE